MSENETGRPSDRLKRPRRPWLAGVIAAATVAALSGIGVGAYAIAQTADAPVETVAAEVVPTEEPNQDPTASFSVLSVDGLNVTVDGSNSYDPEGDVDYAWDFGDGATSSESTVTHGYGAYGTYTITLTVTDSAGAGAQFSTNVDLIAPPPPPDPDPPAATAGCPSGSFVAQGGPGVDLLCMWNYCANLTLPDPAHPECDQAFRP